MGSFVATPRRHKHLVAATVAVRFLPFDLPQLEQVVRSLSAGHTVVVDEQPDGSFAGSWTYVARSASRHDVERVLRNAGYQTTADPKHELKVNTVYLANRGSTLRKCDCPTGQPNCIAADPYDR